MRVCVVGAGTSGLTTIKQLRDEGHEVLCFDKNDDLGGIWLREADAAAEAAKTKACDNLYLTISMKLMAYSDRPFRGDRVFYTREQYHRYLLDYADEFGLAEHIRFGTEVVDVQRAGRQWAVTVTDGEAVTTEIFDAVAVCSGPFRTPNRRIDGLESFTGEVVHSAEYRNSEPFRGKRVLIVGLAESGADVVREVGEVASAATLSIRSYSFLLPRVTGARTTDHGTVRAHHHEMLRRSADHPFALETVWGRNPLAKAVFLAASVVLGVLTTAVGVLRHLAAKVVPALRPAEPELNPLGQPMYPLKLDLNTEHTDEHWRAIRDWNRRSHPDGSWTQRSIFCKNVTFIPSLVSGQVALNDSGIERFDGATVHFRDGGSGEFDTVILCTGYTSEKLSLGALTVPENNIRNLYKHFLHPEHDGSVAFIGFIRPFTGGVPICAEMQARYFARVLSGALTPPRDIGARIARERLWEEHWSALSPRHPETTPSQVLYLDALAKEIGCLIPMSMMLTRPRLFAQLWFGSFNQSCYRVVGPHNRGRDALDDLLAEPIGNRKEMALRMSLLQLMPARVHPTHLI